MQAPLVIRRFPAWNEILRERRINYNLEETGKAYPLVLAELLPGLPKKEFAAKLHLLDYCSSEVASWLSDPSCVLLPESRWPSAVPKARVNVASESEWLPVRE